jgi:hypothetical protein
LENGKFETSVHFANENAYYLDSNNRYRIGSSKFFLDESNITFAVKEARSDVSTSFITCVPFFAKEGNTLVKVWSSVLADSTSSQFDPETYRNKSARKITSTAQPQTKIERFEIVK